MPRQPLIKICANTSQRDLQLAADCGADYAGMVVDFPPSPRHVPLERARQMHSPLPLVAVTVNLPIDHLLEIAHVIKPAAMQLHGDESGDTIRSLSEHNIPVWKAVSGADAISKAHNAITAGAEAVLVDSRIKRGEQIIYGGTGVPANWDIAKSLVSQGGKVVLAGGLNVDNVHQAIDFVQPWLIDAVSGVEEKPGIKDPGKVRSFIKAIRNATAR